MSEFDAIRPYHDHEVPDVLARLVASRELAQAASELVMPSWLKSLAGPLANTVFASPKNAKPEFIRDCQNVAGLFEKALIEVLIDCPLVV